MNKTYQKPETKVVQLQSVQLLAGSVEMIGKDATGAGMARRRGGSWDNDDEDY